MTSGPAQPPAFDHDTRAQRVRFGPGQAARLLRDEVARAGAPTTMVIAGDRHRDLVEDAGLGAAPRIDQVVPHVPLAVAERARATASRSGAGLIVAVGGGSAIGLAKAVALTAGLPIVAVPTTYAGSEATDVWGLTENGHKRTGSDVRVLPRVVIYDADLAASLPLGLALASGVNAVAHCVDSMWGPRVDPIDEALAMEGLRALARALPQIAAGDRAAVGSALYGCYLAGVVFASAGSGLHHKICHVLGGAFGLPHASTHAIVLPHVVAFNAPSVPAAADRIATALGAPDAVTGIDTLRTALGTRRALRDVGLAEADLPRAAALIAREVPPSNPRPVGAADLSGLLYAAWSGTDPAARPRETT